MPLPSLRTLLMTVFIASTVMSFSGCEQQGERQKLKIGYMNCNSRAETLARFTPLTAYLSEYTGIDFETVPVDTHEFAERYEQGEFALTHTNSLLYIQMKHDHNLNLLVTEKRGNFGSRSAGTIIAKKGSGIKTLADIKGKRMVFGPMMAPTGYLAQYDLMLRNGIDPERDLAYYAIPSGSFKHEKLIYGVYFGQFDVAAAPILDLEVMTREGKITADDFVILGQSPLVPYCTFGADEKLDADLVAKIKQALLGLTPESTIDINGERIKVLKSAWVDGFEALLDGDYDPVREMAKRVNMPPYQEF